MKEQVLHTTEGGIVYEPSLLSKPAHQLFDPGYWADGATVQGGRGSVMFIADGGEHGHGPWVLRHYRRGGMMARLLDDRYLWRGADNTRSFREWRLLHALHAQGLPVPIPVAARFVRRGLLYRADLLTAEIRGARTLTQRLRSAALNAAEWRSLGVVLAQFHSAGVQHADLNAHNIVFDMDDRPLLLDFDRGCLRLPGIWHETVLARLQRSLRKLKAQQDIHYSDDDWQQLLASHQAALKQ